jgi:hypothetical protein
MNLELQFDSVEQEAFYKAVARNQCFSGGFNNGKTWVGCLKSMNLLNLFTNYRMIIAREKYTDLKRSTMQTFFKMCPSELIVSHNEQDGVTLLSNSSLIYWIHLDNADENTLRGMEPNSILVDQAEETSEKMYDVLDARLGRWDGVIIPVALLELHEKIYGCAWPTNKFGRYIVPSYLMLLCNPEDEFHYIYRKYHPDSPSHVPGYFYVEGQWRPSLGSEESYDVALTRDPEWVAKYVKGQWGSSSAAIHFLHKDSILEPTEALLDHIRTKGNLFRVLDHGDSAPTCCLWVAAIDGVYIFYREYYVAGRVISYHRKAISDLSKDESYSGNYADPSIFKKNSQKQGGFWCVADEYRDSTLPAPVLMWIAADNNEFATRNRINELLMKSLRHRHPITRETPAPGIYFIKSDDTYPEGCKEAIRQISAQRKKLLGTFEGKSIYSDDRDDSIPDHSYDCVRYFIAMHGSSPRAHEKRPPRNSFAYFNALLKQQIGMPIAGSVNR